MKRKVCILGTFHDYQYRLLRKSYLSTVISLIEIHSVDFIAEEAAGVSETYFSKNLAELKLTFGREVRWSNVDLDGKEREGIPDVNPQGTGTLVDLDLQVTREWVWVTRTAHRMKDSALLICGCVHSFSVAEKFRWAGFEVEVHVHLDAEDVKRVTALIEPPVINQ
jgi:hypothetical protein